uniref:hypothetical protein n=1 Tax=Psychrobacter sp. TaxID=56811 RepID=UPI0015EF7AB3|nr:hypothetical protein [Psychrobacter sp.]
MFTLKVKLQAAGMLTNVDIQMRSAASQTSIKKYIKKWFLLYYMIRKRKTRMTDRTAPRLASIKAQPSNPIKTA